MRTFLQILLPLIILALGALGAKQLIAMKPEVEPAAPEPLPPLVEVVVAQSEAVELWVHTQGTVVPRTASRLVSEVSGRVLEASSAWVDGGFFDEGELLLSLDPTDYELQKSEARSRVAQAELRLAQEEAEAEISLRDWRSERGDEDPPSLVAREPQIADAQATLEAARAALQKSERDVERCRVVAPFPGRVRTKRADRGEFVMVGAELGSIYAVDHAEVRLPLPDTELAFLNLPLSYRGEESAETGIEVILSARFAGGDHEWNGRIVRTEGELDPKSRMVYAVARVDDPYGRDESGSRPPLAIGMFVDAAIRGETITDAITLPRAALRTGDLVFVIDNEDLLRIRPVDVLRTERDRAMVRGGLEVGERVIVSPIEEAVDGMHVRALETREEDR